ncbi:hypothetical protein CORC01_11148 [Colletotrichum orchidophilum]|uniref:FAD/NAD(P)-binding domain-containing protein n=1 Tax=Colletotrichum orchidophilum TaxID=1209926 RepID=A0A1G4AWP8_9PEZI|nr:uncharacterized protein CORC01_11148 [Colletotrichum orchidophilum]OHE93551.1 hypothetical protein CORC01_11148 [Colletotrichum orchidophilum]
MELPDNPPKVDIRTQIYETLRNTAELLDDWDAINANEAASGVVLGLSKALQQRHHHAVEGFFARHSSHWKDTLALTAHLRSFKSKGVIASALLELHILRKAQSFQLEQAQVMEATDELKWLDCEFSFRTTSPKAFCRGKMMLIPDSRGTGQPDWKIWSMSTYLAEYEDFPEDEDLLRLPSAPIADDKTISTSVLIVGGGNAGLILAARLKALDIDYVVVDRNSKVGDNWASRYDCMRFHVYKSFCETPYIPYPQTTNEGLTRDQLADQIVAFAKEFDLNRRVLHRTSIAATEYDQTSKTWRVELATDNIRRTLSCKCMVLATGGAGFAGPAPLPDLPGQESFKGPNIHSAQYRNASDLVSSGAKSVAIIGSGNTAFDVLVDCHDAGLKTTMVQRSDTYVVPMTYFAHPMGFGVYDILPAEDADVIVNGGPLAVGGAILGLAHTMQAAQEPDRYNEARKAGLRVQDSLTGDLLINLIDRCGGHFVDMGTGMDLITTKKVGVRSGVVPTSYTANGLVLSDGTRLEADAIVWCIGFGNIDGRKNLPDTLGAGAEDIARRLEPTWGADAQGEIRGLWKRHPDVDNLWIFAGGTAQHRWFSKVIALQVKGVLEGILPDAYRHTPEPQVAEEWRRGETWAPNL